MDETKTLEAILASPPERDELVVQLFVKDGGQWGEVFRDDGRLWIELYSQGDGEPWKLSYPEFLRVLSIAATELAKRLS